MSNTLSVKLEIAKKTLSKLEATFKNFEEKLEEKGFKETDSNEVADSYLNENIYLFDEVIVKLDLANTQLGFATKKIRSKNEDYQH